MRIPRFLTKIGQFAMRHMPKILTGVGIIGSVAAAASAGKAAWDAKDIVEELKANDPEITNWEIVKEIWPMFVPAGLELIASSSCFIGSTAISEGRVAAMGALYSGLQLTADKLGDQVQEVLGPDKFKILKAKSLEKEIRENPPEPLKSGIMPINSVPGAHMCMEAHTKQIFYSTTESIRGKINDLNGMLLNSWASFTDWLMILGLDDQLQSGSANPYGMFERLIWDIGEHVEFDIYTVTYSNELLHEVPITVVEINRHSWPHTAR